jgi:ribosomal protein S18 acetylase RimI-like enzyme
LTPKSKTDFENYYHLRWKILRAPWNQPIGSEKDDLEDRGIHIMACESNRIPVGVGRGHFNSPQEAQIRFMAVDEEYQGKGIGSLILRKLERKLKMAGAKSIILNARKSALEFYKKKGYKILGEGHVLFGAVPHFEMKKDFY